MPLVVVVGVVDDWPALPPELLLPLVPPPVCALKPSARKSAGATSHVDFIVVLLITGIVASRMMACQLPECRANNCQLTIPCCRAILSWLIFFLASVTAVSFSRFCWGLGAAAKWTASISDVLFAAGISWDVAHNLISGISYFAVWMVIWRGSLADMANVSD
ncbi:MAG: hypothetical protein ACJ71U_13915 [Terriglobales bacterium]